jgi:hypothetical protein
MDKEAITRKFLSHLLENDFFVHENVSGYHKNNNEIVKYDLVIKPKQHLIERGFHDGYVVIEIKHFDETDKVKHETKLKDLIWQCVAYSFSEITLSNQKSEKPLFVLYYIAGQGINPLYKDSLNFLHHFVQRGGVGRIDTNAKSEWSMVFGGSFYFRKIAGKGKNNVGVKRQTGSSR